MRFARIGSALAALVMPVVLAVVACTGGETVQPAKDGAATFQRISMVLLSPRCLNCHQAEAPLQGDDGHRHNPPVIRGADSHGVGAMRCTDCHSEHANNPTSKVPGAPAWSLAPPRMIWAGLTVPELCASLKDPEKNGHRSGADLVHHMDQDPLVLWGWNPGAARTPAPIPHDEFMALFKSWVAGGSVCPV